MDNIQILLIVVVISLTILLLVVGIQVLLIILDMKRALRRLNSILDDSILGGGLLRPEKLTGILELLRNGKGMRGHGTSEDHMKEV
ncbi:hypothetical protein KBA63_05455 [Candidatus Woesebacteria bacterium]|jgi:hypothetical protein|nr:hypothetical protein [Candidatus Woesebacteria bacterium]MBP9687475.1 hypothetical protein [Candidatus Woesebacteria bacterium]